MLSSSHRGHLAADHWVKPRSSGLTDDTIEQAASLPATTAGKVDPSCLCCVASGAPKRARRRSSQRHLSTCTDPIARGGSAEPDGKWRPVKYEREDGSSAHLFCEDADLRLLADRDVPTMSWKVS